MRTTTARRGHAAALLLVLLVLGPALASALASALAPSTLSAQEPVGVFEIVGVRHEVAGSLTVSLRAGAPDELRSFTASLDGVPLNVQDVRIEDPPPLSVVLAIDTSGSMEGEPLFAAQQAARELVAGLAPEDSVAVVTFADSPQLLLPFTTDRVAVDVVIDQLVAAGNTALYDTAGFVASLIDSDAPERAAVVLLSDGEDYGATTATTREGSIEALAASSAPTYAFALGFEADADYLAAVAEASGGEFWSVPSSASLTALFAELGVQLGQSAELQLSVPPISRGSHQLTLRAVGFGQTLEATHRFDVSNEGLLTLEVIEPETPGERIRIAIVSPAPSSMRVEAAGGDRVLDVVPGSPRVALVDPWTQTPGELPVTVTAYAGSAVAASQETVVTVPALDPAITVRPESGAGRTYTVEWRSQPGPPLELVVSVDGDELARTSEASLSVEAPGGAGALLAALHDDTGQTVASQEVRLPSAAGGGVSPAVALPVGLVALALLLLLRRRRRARRPPRPHTPRPATQTYLRRRIPESPVPRPGTVRPIADVLVVSPDGEQRSYPLSVRPLTIGASQKCDIVINGPDVRAEHARISPMGNGTFQVHGVNPFSRPYDRAASNEWLVVEAGESIEVGGYVLTIQQPSAQAQA